MEIEGIKGIPQLSNIMKVAKPPGRMEKSPISDTITISEAGKSAQEFGAYLKKISMQIINGTESVRQDKVLEAKERINTGYYFQEGVKEALSQKLLTPWIG